MVISPEMKEKGKLQKKYTPGTEPGDTTYILLFFIPKSCLIYHVPRLKLDGGVGINGSRVLQRHLYRAVQEDVGGLDGGVKKITADQGVLKN